MLKVLFGPAYYQLQNCATYFLRWYASKRDAQVITTFFNAVNTNDVEKLNSVIKNIPHDAGSDWALVILDNGVQLIHVLENNKNVLGATVELSLLQVGIFKAIKHKSDGILARLLQAMKDDNAIPGMVHQYLRYAVQLDYKEGIDYLLKNTAADPLMGKEEERDTAFTIALKNRSTTVVELLLDSNKVKCDTEHFPLLKFITPIQDYLFSLCFQKNQVLLEKSCIYSFAPKEIQEMIGLFHYNLLKNKIVEKANISEENLAKWYIPKLH